ncbi:MAG: glycosyltransferase [Clostridia bacterium]|nr:glycosyltransferase [Clostridia bacterium]
MMGYVTVIIPARNEENNVCRIINFLKNHDIVNQIVVVNNCSDDNTFKLASEAGAQVVDCNDLGKGYAMETGLKFAKNEVIVFLDADVDNYFDNMVELLSEPIFSGEADFVKSTFERTKGGVVTEVAVKPMLSAFYPDMYKFSEPISGMIAARKDVFESLDFEKDYGVDIGILIDVIEKGYRVSEVNIGRIENMSHINKTVDRMSKMSSEIINAIAKRVNNK